jgi:hypothetical protein
MTTPGPTTSHNAQHRSIMVTHPTTTICVIDVADELDLRTATTLQQLIT